MDRYTLTFEGRMRFRRMMARVGTESWEGAEDYEVLNFIYEHGSATLEEIAQHARLSWDQTTNRLMALMYHGFLEEVAG